MSKRVFLIVLDSFGIGQLPDAADFGDEGSNTLAAVRASGEFHVPTLASLGLFHIDGVDPQPNAPSPQAAYARLAERSAGKDTTVGHWEIAGVISHRPLPTYPGGFPPEVVDALRRATGRDYLCNRPYSGTAVLEDYGPRHMETGHPILYTSADSVMQIAAHESVIPMRELDQICSSARALMQGEHGVGRIIARPFIGEPGGFTRTAGRHDYSLEPPAPTMLDHLHAAGLDVIGVGKIGDIFAGRGLTKSIKTDGNAAGMRETLALARESFTGLCFVNLVDFDMKYGHRNDVDGYAAALTAFDRDLAQLLPLLREEDLLIITADHGCDPSTASTDHSREYVPMLCAGPAVRPGVNLGTRPTFADIAATVLGYFQLEAATDGASYLHECTDTR